VESIEHIIRRALVQGYALEGSYPPSLEHVEAYGVILDYNRYVYYFEWFASNIIPTVVVLER
jgi:hypothetical protein